MAKPEGIGARLKRLRLERGLSQRDLSSPGISYAYISRIESGARTPSVKALRRIAGKLGVTVEHLETGEPTPVERGVADAGLEFASLTAKNYARLRPRLAEGRARALSAPQKKLSRSGARSKSQGFANGSTSSPAKSTEVKYELLFPYTRVARAA
jgi:transcriptional regulator with XRE-family HTH domain